MMWLNARQMSQLLFVSRGTLNRYMKDGLPYYRLGKRVLRFDEKEVNEWIKKERSSEKWTY